MGKKRANNSNEFYSNVSGTMSGDESDTRQLALEMIAGLMKCNKAVFMDIVPDPENKWDRDALALYANLPDIGRTQVGFVKNAQHICDFCDKEFEREPRDKATGETKCTRCGHGKPDVRRNGLASKIAKELRADPTVRFYAQVMQVTGGSADKPNRGCNIVIRRVIRPPDQP